jgi:tRNA/tmRNA/rRNA uracil-C5-methylase (TrmA/RlmC/RlmD family)
LEKNASLQTACDSVRAWHDQFLLRENRLSLHNNMSASGSNKRARPSSFSDRMAAFKSRVLSKHSTRADKTTSSTSSNKQGRQAKQGVGKASPADKNNNNRTNQLQSSTSKQLTKTNGKKKKTRRAPPDPSARYLARPCQAPLVKHAKHFLTNELGKAPRIVVGPTKGWRTSSKLSVRGTPALIGLFAPGSHDMVEMHTSVAHHPAINRATKLVAEAVAAHRIPGYDGVNAGGLSYVAFNVELESAKVQLTLVFNATDKSKYSTETSQITEYITKADKQLWHSVWMHCNPANRHDNNIFARSGGIWHREMGPEHMQDRLNIVTGLSDSHRPTLHFPPFVFRQANIMGFSNIVNAVRKWVPRDSLVVELYGGVGTIGLHLLDLASRVECSDENPHNQACFNKSVVGLPAVARKVTYRTASAATVALEGGLQNAEVVVVDPPRKGLDAEVLQALASNRTTLKRLVYVSCGFKALQRDWKALREMGMVPVHAEGHVLFPGADHLETLAVFDRVKEPRAAAKSAGTAAKGRRVHSEEGGGKKVQELELRIKQIQTEIQSGDFSHAPDLPKLSGELAAAKKEQSPRKENAAAVKEEEVEEEEEED